MALAMRATLALALLVLAPRIAVAGTHVSVAAGGGLGPLDVSVDLASGTVVANGVKVKVELDPALMPGASEVVVEDVPIRTGASTSRTCGFRRRTRERTGGRGRRSWQQARARRSSRG